MTDFKETIWQSDLLASVKGINHGFSTRRGGVSGPPFDSLNLGYQTQDEIDRVTMNRRRFLSAFGLSLDQIVVGEQVHGRKVCFVEERDTGKGAIDQASAIIGTDGLITADRRVGLFGLFADCVPVFSVGTGSFHDGNQVKSATRDGKCTRAVALAHAGWRGTIGEVVVSVIQSFAIQGMVPSELKFALGPCIQRCCFEVSEDVADKFRRKFGSDVVNSLGNSRLTVDLPKANQYLLARAGVQPEMIDVSPLCTSCDSDVFFSHRRDAGRTGRMGAVIVKS